MWAELNKILTLDNIESAKQNLKAVKSEVFRHLESINDGIAETTAAIRANQVDNEVKLVNLRVEAPDPESDSLNQTDWIGPAQGSYWLIEQIAYKGHFTPASFINYSPYVESQREMLHVAKLPIIQLDFVDPDPDQIIPNGTLIGPDDSGVLQWAYTDMPKIYVRSGQQIRLSWYGRTDVTCDIQVQQFTKEPKFDAVG